MILKQEINIFEIKLFCSRRFVFKLIKTSIYGS
jgi:hypothetical protein